MRINMAPITSIMLAFALACVVRASPVRNEIKLAEIGWTDVSATTAVAYHMLKALGYDAKVSLVSTPVAFKSLKNGDIDVFLGNWMPSMEADIRPYVAEGSIEQWQQNLSGARYTLAVPRHVYEAGVHSFADLKRFKKEFLGLIYGIEAGNDGNRLILDLIKKNDFDLGSWEIVESNEQGMLVSVANAIKRGEFIVFLAWSPHP